MIDEILVQQARRELEALADNPDIRREMIGDYLMAMSDKEKQAAYVERMKAENYKRVTVWLSPKSQKAIERVQIKNGLTRDKAIEFLLLK